MKRYRTICLALPSNGHGAGHTGVDGTVVVEGAGSLEGEAVAASRGDVAAAGAGLAVAFRDSVGGAIFVGPGDSRTFFNGNAGWAEGEVLDCNTVGARCGGARSVVTATARHIIHVTV